LHKSIAEVGYGRSQRIWVLPKLIVDTYRDTGEIFETKSNHKKRMEKESNSRKRKRGLERLKKPRRQDHEDEEQEVMEAEGEEQAAEIPLLPPAEPANIENR
jgi:hypothetical protein